MLMYFHFRKHPHNQNVRSYKRVCHYVKEKEKYV